MSGVMHIRETVIPDFVTAQQIYFRRFRIFCRLHHLSRDEIPEARAKISEQIRPMAGSAPLNQRPTSRAGKKVLEGRARMRYIYTYISSGRCSPASAKRMLLCKKNEKGR